MNEDFKDLKESLKERNIEGGEKRGRGEKKHFD